MSLRKDGAAIAAIVALTLLLFWPALTGHLFELRDYPRWTWPSRELWRQAILAGRIPQWNPTVGLGVPTLAIPVHGTFYPGHLLLLIAPTWWSLGLTWTVHAAFAGVGGYVLCRALGCRPTSAFVAGATFAIGGYAVSMWGDGEKVLSGAWVPWVSAFLVQRRVSLAAVALAMIALAGDPFLWLHAVGLALAVTCETERFVRRAAAAIGIGLLLASVALVPAIALMGESERAAGIASDEAVRWSMHPVRLLELIAPGALGDPYDMTQYPGARLVREPALGDTPWAIGLYAGAAVGLFAPFAGKRRLSFALAAVALVALVAAMGRFSPIDRALRFVVPPLRYLRYPEKHALLMVSALAVLAALGCERALSDVSLKRLPLPLASFGALAALLSPRDLPVWSALAHTLAMAALFILSIAIVRRRAHWAPLVAAVAAIDLFVSALPLTHWTDPPRAPPPLAAIMRRDGGPPPRLYRPRYSGVDLATMPENLGELWGIAHVPGHDAALSARFHQLWDRLSGEQAMTLFGIDWMLMPGAPPGLTPVASVGPLVLTRWPRARRLTDGCEFERYAPESVAIRCNAPTAMTMVLADAYSPGWSATIDGAPVAIQRAHDVLRGVPIPAGEHHIELRYRTPGLTLGICATALGLALCAWRARRYWRAAATSRETSAGRAGIAASTDSTT